MFYVIDGGAMGFGDAPEANGVAMDVTDKIEERRAEAAPTAPTDWSNIVFAAQFCEAARAAYRGERLAG